MNKAFTFLFALLLASRVPGSPAAPMPQQPRSLTLADAIRLALEHSPEIGMAEAQIARAKQALQETRALNHPQVVTGTGLAYNNGFPLSIEGAAPSIFQIGMSQSILSKKNKNLILEAGENAKGIEASSEAARNELASKTALVYYELYRARKANLLWASRLEGAQKNVQATQTLLEAGRAKPLDATLARTAAAAAEYQLLISKEQERIAETELKEMTGLSDAPSLNLAEPAVDNAVFAQNQDDLLQRALETSPEIKQAQSVIRAREFHVEAEKGEWRPQLQIVSEYALFSKKNNYEDFFRRFTRNNFLLGLSVQFPLFNGSRTAARVAESQQEVAEARLRLQRARSDLKMSLERNRSGIRVALGAADLAHQEVSAAEESLKVSETLFEGGRISPRELDAARGQVNEKEIQMLDAEKDVFERKIELLRLTGSLASLF